MSRMPLRYLLVDYGVMPFAFNALLNAGIAWVLFRGLPTVPLWGPQSVGGDALATAFLLPAIACLIVTPLVRRDVRQGRQSRVNAPSGLGATLARLTPSARKRSLIAGLIGLSVAGPLSVGVLLALGIRSLELNSFLVWKALSTGLLAAACVPSFAAAALRDDHPVERGNTNR